MANRVTGILRHMLEDANDVLAFCTEAETFETFSQSPLYKKAIVMSIINIGELTKRLPQEFKELHCDIPWRKISGMRDISAHGYHIIEDEIVWDVAKNYIPELMLFLEKAIHSIESDRPAK